MYEVKYIANIRLLAIPRKPSGRLPLVAKDEVLIGIYDQGLGKRYLVCDTYEDMEMLYFNYSNGGGLDLAWGAGSGNTIAYVDLDRGAKNA